MACDDVAYCAQHATSEECDFCGDRKSPLRLVRAATPGQSNRAIEAEAGVGASTVRRARSCSAKAEPEIIIRSDGKPYPGAAVTILSLGACHANDISEHT